MAQLQSLGRYTIRRVLGHGAMGIVYEGLDPRLNRRVAIKTILKAQLDEATQRDYSARFVREAQAVAQLSHPHIVQVHDFGQEGDVAYLVMEFIAGKELKAHLDAGERFSLKDVVRIVGELCEALDFAHERGIIHRDIKPANVIVDANGRVKLADFGVARIQDVSATNASVAGATMVGTPAYMSPEQISGTPVDRRTDVFSAGIVLYQLLTGELPFTGQGAWTIAKKIMQDDPAPPSRVNTLVTPYFDAVVSKALAKSLADRYQSARALGAALRDALEGRGVADDDATVVEKLPPLPPPAAAPGSQEVELEFWRSIKDGNEAEDFEAYLEQFPSGIYHKLARRRLARLRETQDAQRAKQAEEQERREAEEAARREVEVKAALAAEKQKHASELAAQEKARLEAEAKARREAEARAVAEAERARREAALAQQERARAEAEERARREAEARQKAEAEKTRREAELANREAELRRRQAQSSPAGPTPRRWLAAGLIASVIVIAGAGAAWYAASTSESRRLEDLSKHLEVAKNREAELAQSKQREAELLAAAEAAREREEQARKSGDAAKQREAAELAKQREEEARRQAEASKQREAELGRLREAEAKAQAAQRLAEQHAAEKHAAERALAERQVAEKAEAERAAAARAAAAAAEKAAAEKRAAERAEADRAVAARAAADKAAQEKAAGAKTGGLPQAGDTWTYRLVEPKRTDGRKQRVYTVRVMASSASQIRDSVSIDDGGALESTHSKDAYLISQGISIFSPYLMGFGSPAPGTSFTVAVRESGCSGYNCSAQATVVGSEKISVPAGTFDTVRVKIEHLWTPASGAHPAQWGAYNGGRDVIVWYSPVAKRVVKMSSRLNVGQVPPLDSDYDLELVSYQLK